MMSADDGHVTTLAVDPRWQRHQIGTRLLLVLAREAIAREARSLTLEVRLSNRPAQELYRRFGFAPVGVRKNYYAETNEDALVMWAHEATSAPSTPTCSTASSARSRARPWWRSPGAGRRGRGMRILGIETSCDETAAAVVEDGRRRALVDRVEPGRPARPLRRRRARARQPRPRRAHQPPSSTRRSSRRASARPRASSTPSPPATARASPARCSSAVSAAKALALSTGLPYVGGQPPRGASVRGVGSRIPTSSRRSPSCIVSGGHTLLVAHGGPRPLPDARPDRRRRRRRGVRQGRPLPRPRLSRAAPPSTASPPRATRARSGSPGRCSATALRLLLRGPQDRGGQPRAQAPRRAPPPTSPPRSRRRSSTCSSPSSRPPPTRRAPRACAGRRGRRQLAAAGAGRRRPAPRTAPGVPPAPGVVHRQRRHDRRRGLVPLAGRRPAPLDAGGPPRPDA